MLHADGTLSVFFISINPTQNYWLSIQHRNSVETWGSTAINFSSNPNYDFTTSFSHAYGNNQYEVENGVWAFYSGDINQDGVIDAFDYITLDPDVIIGASGYLTTDLTGDSIVDAFDYILLDTNLIAGIGVINP